jgi:hypothetical protein
MSMTPTRDRRSRRSCHQYLLISSIPYCFSVSPVLYNVLMYVIPIELIRFSALNPMELEGYRRHNFLILAKRRRWQ